MAVYWRMVDSLPGYTRVTLRLRNGQVVIGSVGGGYGWLLDDATLTLRHPLPRGRRMQTVLKIVEVGPRNNRTGVDSADITGWLPESDYVAAKETECVALLPKTVCQTFREWRAGVLKRWLEAR